MSALLHELIAHTTEREPDRPALTLKQDTLSYAALCRQVDAVGSGLVAAGMGRLQRVGVYLPKSFESVAAFFGASRAGGVFVPINPLLKAPQVAHILLDCNVAVLVTSAARAVALGEVLQACDDLHTLVLVDGNPADIVLPGKHILAWPQLLEAQAVHRGHRTIDADMAAILYTSGSTGRPKGVVLSHRNMVTGAHSVASYLANTAEDRILSVLPFSFDYGFSQLSTGFSRGAEVVLMDYLLPRDVVRAVARHRITGLAGVPPLWNQIAQLSWPAEAVSSLRYITNSGGAMPGTTLAALQQVLPSTDVFLMYGLTEAFRSTYLPPSEAKTRPDSMGKAIPNAEILVVREDGTRCEPGEPGELVHRGGLVAMGYWNDPEKTAERFRAVPQQDPNLVLSEMAVWSGDTVREDEEGYLYFVGRRDDMIKTSGYRISPTEVEEAIYATGLVGEVCAIGVANADLGQAIAVVVTQNGDASASDNDLLDACRRDLPAFMVPKHVDWRDGLPRTPNGKIDRKLLSTEIAEMLGGTNSV